MADKKSSRGNASLSGLLEEHALIAEREKAEIESRLREREEAEKKARDEAEARERALLQERLEAEKKRQAERLARQRKRAGEEDEEAEKAAAPVAAAPVVHAPPPSAAGKVVTAAVVAALVVAAVAAGLYFALFADNSPAISAVARQGDAIFAESATRAQLVLATHESNTRIASLDGRVQELEGQLKEAHTAIKQLDSEKAAALEKAAEEARLRAEAEAAKSGNGRKRGPKRDPDALTIKQGVFAP